MVKHSNNSYLTILCGWRLKGNSLNRKTHKHHQNYSKKVLLFFDKNVFTNLGNDDTVMSPYMLDFQIIFNVQCFQHRKQDLQCKCFIPSTLML